MTITFNLEPEIEQGLIGLANARGVSLSDYLQEIVSREVKSPPTGGAASIPEARNLVELFANSPFKGLNMDFERDRDYGRDFEW